MHRFAVLLIIPVLVGFAPVPPIRPMTDPDRAVQQFEYQACSTAGTSKTHFADQKRRLLNQLKALQARLAAQGESAEAASVRDYVALVESVDVDRPLGSVKPADLLRQASRDGKYRHLLYVLHVPADRVFYAQAQDFGFWNGANYGGQSNLEPGHWVYIYPRWYVWKDGPARLP